MKYKDLYFSNFLILIDDSLLTKKMMEKILGKGDEFNHNFNDYIYCISTEFEDNFLKISLEFGNPLPRQEKVRNVQTLKKEKNPRKKTQFEPKQAFLIFDFSTSSIWCSNSKKKPFIIDWFKLLFETNNIIIKNVFNENEFIETIKTIDEIRFSASPDLFSENDSLKKALADEIMGYGASVASLKLNFNSRNNRDKLIGRIKNLIKKKIHYKNLVISGRDSRNFGMIFNEKLLSKNIKIKAQVNNNDVFNKDSVYSNILIKLKND